MRVAILHYHLRPGGVTKVIQNALAALSEDVVQTVVIAGESPSATMPIPNYAVVESLRYHDPNSPKYDPAEVVKELESKARQELGALPDLWHIHNHALGKNLVLSEVVYLLVREGQRVLLQPHDFAEDGRPDNYKLLCDHIGEGNPAQLGKRLYPQGTHIHYALINQRDLKFLKACGVEEKQLHYLPNAVSLEEIKEPEAHFEPAFQEKLFLYPARAIRRKNIGEFLLWSAVAQEDDRFAIARSPKNPLARPVYDDWVAFTQSLDLPVEFGIGERWQGDFSLLLKSAHALVTTSVAEGFGLAFLEPWLVERPLVGRNLPEVTETLESTGVDLSALYDRVDIPLEWVNKESFKQEVATHLQNGYEAYGRTMQPEDVERAVNAAIQKDHVDFGKLNEAMQQAVIKQLVASPALRKEIRPSSLEVTASDEMIQRNCKTVLDQFNLEKYGARLIEIYRSAAESEVKFTGELDANALLDQFLAPERFCLLRT